jgi:RsiW-degrading membrane proteinase PrsW (M82 family)
MNWEHKTRLRTQDPRFLWRMVFGILIVGLVIGCLAQLVPRTYARDSKSLQYVLRTLIGSGNDVEVIANLLSGEASIEHVLVAIALIGPSEEDDTEHFAGVLTSKEDSQFSVVLELLRSVEANQPTAALVEMADQQPTVRYANHALGAFYLHAQDFSSAGRYFETEGGQAGAEISRQFAVDAYSSGGNADALARLAKQPEYETLITPTERLVIAEAERDWGTIFWTIPRMLLEEFQQGFATALAIIAGLGWFVVALQLGQVRTPNGARWWLCLLGVVMGGLSIWLTHLFIVWQELEWGITSSDELMDGLKYYFVGVGLREELAKLLMLLPLMPLIVRRGSALEAVIVSACVGLGFAIVENMGYFAATGGTASMGRFLTANFAHMAMTGLIGLAVARACWSSSQTSHAALTFLVVVLAHGAYDASIALPELADYSLAGMIIFVLLAYAFFQEIRLVYSPRPETISLTATFLFVVCSLSSLTFVYLSWSIGFMAGATLLVNDIVGLSVMVYMYLREMPNSMINR